MNQSELRINSKCASIGRFSNGIDLTHSVENEYLYLKLLSFSTFLLPRRVWLNLDTECHGTH